ncbi:MAG: zinc-dependent alcohol dehydrogenase family protein [Rhodospirillaceae bacterium]|nr:zinc-dependent alcohol dehydrogenase family protein [Rhodospirillaceae bacterium]MBT6138786.1 zinc-dependent alcohol dehydrogenase family protein [Rhodospirillaceae bacterium]
MKAAELTAIGPASDVVRCVEVAEPGKPGPGELRVELTACSINPADLLLIEGGYANVPETPCPVGIEGAGIVTAVGEGVTAFVPGDKVMSLNRTNWTQQLLLTEAQVIRMPAEIDLEQAAMLKVNAATSLLMLRDYVTLAAGDWVIQDAANSGVGVNLIRLARADGIRTVNVVRRPELIEPLIAIGADVVLLDGDDLAARVAEATDGADIKLAIDAVAGPIVERLGDCLGDGGVVVNYGLLSGEPCQLRADQVVFKDIRLMGFWLAKKMPAMSRDEVEALYGELATRVVDGTLSVPVTARYPLEDVSKAMAHAGTYGRDGKVLLRPNG